MEFYGYILDLSWVYHIFIGEAILFLTDGEADFGETDFARTKQRAEASSVAIFSYALGSGADTTITKRLACENQGA